MERRSDSTEEQPPPEAPREPEDVAAEVDTVQGWEEDIPTTPELEPDDGYHPEQGGAKYEQPDPVDEALLAQEEGLDQDEVAEVLLEEDQETPEK
jgi:hypothetical protein